MLGRDRLRALFGKQFQPPLNWVKVGFRESADMGLKWVKQWVLTHFGPLLHPKNLLLTHFWTHFRPLTKTHLKPTLSGNKLFFKQGWGSPNPAEVWGNKNVRILWFGQARKIDSVNISCIVFFSVLKPLACGRPSRCLAWTHIRNCLAARKI